MSDFILPNASARACALVLPRRIPLPSDLPSDRPSVRPSTRSQNPLMDPPVWLPKRPRTDPDDATDPSRKLAESLQPELIDFDLLEAVARSFADEQAPVEADENAIDIAQQDVFNDHDWTTGAEHIEPRDGPFDIDMSVVPSVHEASVSWFDSLGIEDDQFKPSKPTVASPIVWVFPNPDASHTP